MIKKTFFILSLLIITFVLNISIVTANENISTSKTYLYQNISGVYRTSNDHEKIVETLDDMNYTLDSIKLKTEGNSLLIQTNINNEDLLFDTMLYPSQIGNNTKNKMIGVVQSKNNNKYDILKLTIEKNADESTLLAPNMNLYGKTVVSFAVYNKVSLEKYYIQFAIDNYDFDTAYNIAKSHLNQNNINVDGLLDIEISYFSLTPKENFINTFNAIEEMTFENSNSVSFEQSPKIGYIIEDLEGKSIDQLIYISKNGPISLSQQTYSLISRLFI